MEAQERYTLRNARYLAADALRRTLREGDIAVDATMGNGGDTLMLCELVGESGHVYAFDVQEQALANTREKLAQAGVESRADLILSGHETMARFVPAGVQAVVFNLGWLPGAAHRVTTMTHTTLTAVRTALELVRPGGLVSVCIYPGHEEGHRELEELTALAASLSVREYTVLLHHFLNAADSTPRLVLIQKNQN